MNISYAQKLREFEQEPILQLSEIQSTLQGLKLDSSLTVDEMYDDNINLSGTSRVHDFITSVIPQLTLLYGGLNADIAFGYQADIEFYMEHPDLDTVKHIAYLKTVYRLSQTLDLRIQDGFVYTPDATDISTTGIVTGRTTQFNNTVSAGLSKKLSVPTSVNLDYKYEIQRYVSANLVNSTEHDFLLAMTHQITPADKINAGAEFRYLESVDFSRQRVYKASVGDSHFFSKTFSIDANGGVSMYPDSTSNYTPYAFVDVSLKKSWKKTNMNIRYQRDLEAGGGLTSGIVANQSADLGIQTILAKKLSGNLSGTYATNKSPSGSSLDIVSYSGTTGLVYEILAWLKGQLQYSYFKQNSHGTASSDFNRNQVFVGLTATLPK